MMKAMNILSQINKEIDIPGNGNRGVGGYFWYTPPGRKFFENTPPPLENLGQAAILFFKWEKNVKIYLNLTRFRSN